jgi:hypothetical protein
MRLLRVFNKWMIFFFALLGVVTTLAIAIYFFAYTSVAQVPHTPITFEPAIGQYTYTQLQTQQEQLTFSLRHTYSCPISCTVANQTRLIHSANTFSVTVPVSPIVTSIPIYCQSTCDDTTVQTAYPIQAKYEPTPEYVAFTQSFIQLQALHQKATTIHSALRYRQSVSGLSVQTVQIPSIAVAQQALLDKKPVSLDSTILALSGSLARLETAYLQQTADLQTVLALYDQVADILYEYRRFSVSQERMQELSQTLQVLLTSPSLTLRQSYYTRLLAKLSEYNDELFELTTANCIQSEQKTTPTSLGVYYSMNLSANQTQQSIHLTQSPQASSIDSSTTSPSTSSLSTSSPSSSILIANSTHCLSELLFVLQNATKEYTALTTTQLLFTKSVQEIKQPLINQTASNASVNSSVQQSAKKTLFVLLHGFGLESTSAHAYSMSGLAQVISNTLGSVNLGVYDWSELSREQSSRDISLLLGQAGAVVSISYYTQPAWFEKKASIEDFAVSVHTQLMQLRQTLVNASDVRIVLVGYSLGGIVARTYAGLFEPPFVTDILTIYTPHQGIVQTPAFLCESVDKTECKQLLDNSQFIRQLAQLPTPAVTALYDTSCSMSTTTGDGVVTKERAFLAGANMIPVHTKSCSVQVHTQVLQNASDISPEFEQLLVAQFS